MNEADIERSRQYWLKRHAEAVKALGVTAAKLVERGISVPLELVQEPNVYQLRFPGEPEDIVA